MRMLEKQHSQRTEKIKQAVSKATQNLQWLRRTSLWNVKKLLEIIARWRRADARRSSSKVQKSCVAEIQAAENSARAAESEDYRRKLNLMPPDRFGRCKVDLLKATSEVDALRESFARLDMEYSCQIPSLRNALEQSRAVNKLPTVFHCVHFQKLSHRTRFAKRCA